jgi:hypothetical protein
MVASVDAIRCGPDGMYPIITVDPASEDVQEPLGSKPKYWFTGGDGRRMLFKAEKRGTGEDWAEKIASELAALLGLPRVPYDLAVELGTGTIGVVCETCAPPPAALVLANELLVGLDPAYPADGSKYKVKAHTVDAVVEALKTLGPPPAAWFVAAPHGIDSAVDVFIGYALLDAWIANTDRHHENWGALRMNTELLLAPTFDHGAALARNLDDADRAARLATKDKRRQLPAYARKARSALYETVTSARPLSTVAAWAAIAARAPAAANIWLQQLSNIDDTTIEQVVAEVPPHRMTDVSRKFTLALIAENRRRLLAGDAS